jgi:hypothetical protein
MQLLKTRCAALCAIAFVTITSMSVGCSATTTEEEATTDETVPAGALDSPSPDVEEGTASVSSELGVCNQCNNCVLYARCRQPRLPYGLTTYGQKVARINSRAPRAGCVAVINTGSPWGHVAYVESVAGGRVNIAEGNFEGRCNRRSAPAPRLGIVGYIC